MSEQDIPAATELMLLDDLRAGDVYVTAGRTVTESDIVSFASLSGDYNRLHVDAEFASGTPHGARIAHGLLVLSISSSRWRQPF